MRGAPARGHAPAQLRGDMINECIRGRVWWRLVTAPCGWTPGTPFPLGHHALWVCKPGPFLPASYGRWTLLTSDFVRAKWGWRALLRTPPLWAAPLRPPGPAPTRCTAWHQQRSGCSAMGVRVLGPDELEPWQRAAGHPQAPRAPLGGSHWRGWPAPRPADYGATRVPESYRPQPLQPPRPVTLHAPDRRTSDFVFSLFSRQLLEFDKELSVFKDRLYELDISFPPR